MPQIITSSQLSYTYLPGSPYERRALHDISFCLEPGEFLGIFGPNGSGKSTLAQLLNGILQPSGGSLTVCQLNTAGADSRLNLWKKVGLVFQYPEQQIFKTTVYEEVAYAPRNLGLAENSVHARVCESLSQVGLEPAVFMNAPPSTLSGGQKRRVAIASLLALQPELLVLDEPMAGLDPIGRQLVLEIIKTRQTQRESTVMISHNLKDILALADKIAILDSGALIFWGSVQDFLENKRIQSRYRLVLPDYLQVACALAERGVTVQSGINNLTEAEEALAALLC